MLEYLLVLLIGFWLGVAIFLYVSCYWIEEILDLPPQQHASSASSHVSSGASGAHAQLKRLVARVVEEAVALPALARYANERSPTPAIESSTYEDLLATAILNKVIERYQNENGSGGRSSGIHSASASPSHSDRSSPRSLNSRNTREISPPLREEDDVSDWEEGDATDEALEMPRRVPFPEFGGDIVHHDNEDRDFDEISSSDIQAVDGSWEENWLFQKKKIKTIQSVPVPMLVPNSNTEYRALIGDRDAEDTTDLSDNASDAEDQASGYKSDIKRVLDSKHEIGGKPKIDEIPVDDYEPDSLMTIDGSDEFENLYNECKEKEEIVDAINVDVDNIECEKKIAYNNEDINEERKDSILILGIDSGPPPKAEFNLNEEIHRNVFNGYKNKNFIDLDTSSQTMAEDSLDEVDHVSNSKSFSDTTANNTLSRHERVGEYEEAVSIPVQRHADSLRKKHYEDEAREYTDEAEKEEDLFPGSVAYRERKKWLNYVEMPNNPYSPEAIQKRLSAKSTSSLFDSLTSKNKEFDVENPETPKRKAEKEKKIETSENKQNGIIIDKIDSEMDSMNLNQIKIDSIKIKDRSPSPKTVKDASEESPQYKRYGRDYYIKEAKSSSGAWKANSIGDISSLSSMHKSTSLDNFDTEFASPVSASSSLSDLEASALHHNIVRAFLSPRNASPNFAINPIFENPDRQNDNADEYHVTDRRTVSRNGLLIKQFTTIETNQHYTKFVEKDELHNSITTTPNSKDEILIEYEDANEQTLFAAKPVFADDDTDKKFEEILQSAYNTQTAPLTIQIDKESDSSDKSPNNHSIENSYISSSSLEDSIKIYNVQTGEIVKCKPEDKVSPRYDEMTDSNDNIHIPDKNLSRETIDRLSPNNAVNDNETVTVNNNSETNNLYKISEIEEILPQLPKVKELAKKFVSMENLSEPSKPPQQEYLRRRKSKENVLSSESKIDKPANRLAYMHSLTARSISKEFRDELKLSMAIPLTVPGGSKEFPEGIEEVTKESSRPGSPLPEPGTIKTKLAFFESLKSKFSNK